MSEHKKERTTNVQIEKKKKPVFMIDFYNDASEIYEFSQDFSPSYYEGCISFTSSDFDIANRIVKHFNSGKEKKFFEEYEFTCCCLFALEKDGPPLFKNKSMTFECFIQSIKDFVKNRHDEICESVSKSIENSGFNTTFDLTPIKKKKTEKY